MTQPQPPDGAGERVLVGLSGGVDSSVAAALSARGGARVECAYMKNWINEEEVVGDCPWREDVDYARRTADRLGLPFRIVNLMRDYRERIVDYLIEGYRAGRTPNPDVFCNREMKFGVFLEWARRHGMEAVATGHYARRLRRADGEWELHEGADPDKDQSYFLAMLGQRQLAAARFPVGDLAKPEVRRIASDLGLPTAARKDSQGICFIGNVRMADFLEKFIPEQPGPIVDPQGRTLGEHRGLHFFTLGQRRGVGVASPVDRTAYVVVAKNAARNELVVALDDGAAPGLYAARCLLGSLSFINEPIASARQLEARPRYRAPRVAARAEPVAERRLLIEFATPQRALTPGQVCALHDGRRVLGAGVFEQVLG